MKKRNGFTLVELLAVIVVLAIIMIIAIPSVLDVMNNARKSSFVLYVEKVVTAVQTQYTYDSNGGAIGGAGLYAYDITSDLNLTSTGNYKGYVIVNALDVDNVEYSIFLYDKNWELLGYNITAKNMPTTDTKELKAYNEDDVSTMAASALLACDHIVPGNACYNRNGFKIVAGTSSATE